MRRTIWQTVRSITNDVLGVKGLTFSVVMTERIYLKIRSDTVRRYEMFVKHQLRNY